MSSLHVNLFFFLVLFFNRRACGAGQNAGESAEKKRKEKERRDEARREKKKKEIKKHLV